MLSVSDLMTRAPDTVSSGTSLREVLSRMNADGCRHLPVLDGDTLVGIITDRDVRLAANSPVLADVHQLTRRALLDEIETEDCMSRDPLTVSSNMRASEAAEILVLHGYGAVPVVDDGKLVGMLSVVDFLKYMAASDAL